MGLEEITMEINSLKQLITVIDDNLKFNISVFIALLALFIAAAGWALSQRAKSIIEKSVQTKLSEMKEELRGDITSETKQIKDELFELKGGLDQHILSLVENNAKIRWASGSLNSEGTDQFYVGGLNGNIDWDSPITSVRVRDTRNKVDVPFELVDKRENSFTFKVPQETTTKYLDWIIVWYEKNR